MKLSELSLDQVKALIPFRVLSAKGVVEGTVDWIRNEPSTRANNHPPFRTWIHVTWDTGNWSMDELENFEHVSILEKELEKRKMKYTRTDKEKAIYYVISYILLSSSHRQSDPPGTIIKKMPANIRETLKECTSEDWYQYMAARGDFKMPPRKGRFNT